MGWNFSGRAFCRNAQNKDYVIEKKTAKNGNEFALMNVATREFNQTKKCWQVDSYVSLLFFGEEYKKLLEYDVRKDDMIIIEKGFFRNTYNAQTRRTQYVFIVKEFSFDDEQKKAIPPEPEVIKETDEKEYIGSLPF